MKELIERGLLDPERACEFLGGISKRTLERWRMSGGGPRYIKLGRRVFYTPDQLSDFAMANEVRNTAQAARRAR